MIEFGIKDFLDILLVASLLFYVYRLMKESRSLNIFVGIMLFVLIWLFVSQILEMRLLGSILDKLVSVGVIALIVIFQEDIRRFLYEIGSQKGMRRLVRFFHSSKESQKEANKETIMPIVMACMSMAKKYVGALIVVERGVPLKDIMDTGEEIDAKINQRLIENIFFKNSPLHDGAMVISKKRIKAAGCILPVSHNLDIPKGKGFVKIDLAPEVGFQTKAVDESEYKDVNNYTVQVFKSGQEENLIINDLYKNLVTMC